MHSRVSFLCARIVESMGPGLFDLGRTAYPALRQCAGATAERVLPVCRLVANGLDAWAQVLERGYEARNTNMPYISVAPIFDSVRQHPRFRALLQRMNLPM